MLNFTFFKWVIVTLIILPTGCMTAIAKKSKADASLFTLPAKTYLDLAQREPTRERQNLLIMAAGRLIMENSCQEAAGILSQTEDLTSAEQAKKILLLSKIDLCLDAPKHALSRMAKVDKALLPTRYYQALYHDILATAYEDLSNLNLAITERIKLEDFEENEESLAKNRSLLWQNLTRLPNEELNTLIIESREASVMQGWAKLALASKESLNSEMLADKFRLWMQAYPNHPGGEIFASLVNSKVHVSKSSTPQIALLLPLSGDLSGPGEAIKDGIMSVNEVSNQENLRLYDTAKVDVTSLYQQALNEGADFVIGPLTKTDVAKVASLEHPVPTFLLNETEKQEPNLFSFGLSPRAEAREVARKAYSDGFSHALIISPEGPWGSDIVAAFSQEWAATSGEVVEVWTYNDKMDLGEELRLLLHVSKQDAEPNKKPKEKSKIKGTAIKRRQDFDMIFLLAYPSKARQIVPLLKYYFAGDVPFYATSSVYSGNSNTLRDRDLDGVRFCDLPWVFSHQLANKNWPEQWNSYNRLYSLGVESYHFLKKLGRERYFEHLENREFAWGKFKGGTIQQIKSSQG